MYHKIEKNWDEDRIEEEELEYIEEFKLDNGAIFRGFMSKDKKRHGPGT